MTDFYALLKQSMIDRGLRDENDRKEVYAQARRAVVKQLWDFRPPLAADEIDMRVGAYDTAVERIESELREAFAAGEIAVQTKRPPRQPSPPAPLAAPPTPPAADGDDDSPPLANWWEEDEQQIDVERAPPRKAAARTAEKRPAPIEEAVREEPADETDDEDTDGDAGEEPYAVAGGGTPSRWSKRRAYDEGVEREAPTPILDTLLGWLGTEEQRKIRLLAIAIGALFIILVGIGTYYFATRQDGGVTLPIGVRHEVSDAATATRVAGQKLPVAQSFSVFAGKDPTIFMTTPDNPVRFDSANGFARVSSSISTPGVKVLIGPGLAASLAGHNVRVTIVARSSPDSGAAAMRFAYQSGYAISYWQTANLGNDYAPVAMLWRVPAMRTNPAGDYLRIEPGIPGDGTSVDIQSITIDVLSS
jgi:hypothetical protein